MERSSVRSTGFATLQSFGYESSVVALPQVPRHYVTSTLGYAQRCLLAMPGALLALLAGASSLCDEHCLHSLQVPHRFAMSTVPKAQVPILFINLIMILYLVILIRATVVPLLLSVAFLTLVERKVMGAMQRRVGPTVWGFFGIFQRILDGLKLLLKEPILPSRADNALFLWAPVLTFLTSQILRRRLPTSRAGAISDLSLGTMYVLAVGSLGVYGILLAGWSRNSKYAFLGCCRSVAQMISYELPMGLIVLTACLYANSLNWSALVHSQENSLFLFPLWPMGLIWFVCSLAELNRAPMDLPEAERELVAGYNVEYASMGFALFFIREYANMIAMRTLTALLFLGGGLRPFAFLSFLPYSFWLRIKRTRVVFAYIWVRATLPRYKYSQLMRLGWKRLLPLALAGFVRNAVFVFVAQII